MLRYSLIALIFFGANFVESGSKILKYPDDGVDLSNCKDKEPDLKITKTMEVNFGDKFEETSSHLEDNIRLGLRNIIGKTIEGSVSKNLFTPENQVMEHSPLGTLHTEVYVGKALSDSNEVGTGSSYLVDNVDKLPKNYSSIPKHCTELWNKDHKKSGIYLIKPELSDKPFHVLCDMDMEGGGWTHIHKRFDGSQDFYKGWREYKFGFGNLKGEFWMGLKTIYEMTGHEASELLIEIVDRDGTKAYAYYKHFGIGLEAEGYPLKTLSDFSGDAGDSLTAHFGQKFSTHDLDQDKNNGNCAQMYRGAWWYNSCHISNLNGQYINIDLPEAYKFKGMHWKTFRSHEYCHAKARMLIRPCRL